MNTSIDKNATVSRILDSLVHENMGGHEQIRTKLEALLLSGKLDDRVLNIVLPAPLQERDDIQFSLVEEKGNKYTYRITVAEPLKLWTGKG